MLAQNLKTAAELGITQLEFDALVQVLGMLERGEIKHEPRPTDQYGRSNTPTTFNLAAWRCGTAACIGGWAESVAAMKFREYEGGGLDRLFYPDNYEDEIGWRTRAMLSVTTAQAASALRNYLTIGEPRWAEVLEG